MNIHENKVADLKAAIEKLNKQLRELTASKPNRWEPRGGEWLVRHYGPVGTHISDNDSRLFGTEYKTNEKANWARDKMRSFNRLLAYVAEFDVDKSHKQWEADWTNAYSQKCSIRYCHTTNKWYLLYHTTMQYLTTYMSEQCAIDLAAKLNSGKVIL